MTTRILFVIIVLSSPMAAVAQGQADLDKLDQKITKYFERMMPRWEHKRGEPIVKTENVVIEFFYTANRAVKIAASPRKSAEEAREAVKDFRMSVPTELLQDIGDEAYGWGYGSANVIFRRGRCVVFVTTYAEVDSDADARTLTQEQRFERERKEKRRLSLEFAKHASKAMEDQ